MHRRMLAIGTALAAAVALTISGCASGNTVAGPEARTKHGPITIWYSNNAQEVTWGKGLVSSWNKDHPDEPIKAQEVPAGKSTEEVIGAAITAGTTPCLVFNNLPAATGQFQKQGGLVDLSKFPGADAYIEARSGKTADQYKSPDGDYYQMPWKSNPVMMFYNKKVFAKAGLSTTDPKLSTYADFLAAAAKIKATKAAPFAIYPAATSEFFQPNFDFLPLYAAETGGTGLLNADQKATFDNAAGKDVTDFWKTVYAKGYAGKDQLQGDAFATGQAAMAMVGPWAVASYKGAVDWGVVPVPTKDGTAASKTWTFPDAKNAAMYASCKNQGTAWDVLKYATSPAQDKALLQTTGQMPIRKDLASTYADYFAKNPSYQEFGAQAARTVDDPTGPNSTAVLQAFRNFYTKAVISGDGSLDDQLAAAAAKTGQLAVQK
ncbi:extracellular solute-binding protein [Curtobacterium sp. Leaf261]|uniref:extracellular solute-binding protein n=1 Tax=Curtobacterium sp. Leaf261 TaxID=1736311 RepID=UPI0006F89B04|nr:extracellular solute-binding protein [Curtobacterium sp. Leaf261]KQO60030.1 sugar ABC transporter substrate-binding protein [Curtobacterium sp. Leaf261]